MNRKRIFVIAEAGVNHNGSLERALAMIDVAADAGADAVKFQTFKADRGISRFAPKAAYQIQTTGESESQLQMARKLEFDKEDFIKLASRCRQKDIMFLSTPFDLESVDLLAEMGLEIFKIPSGEIVNLPLLRRIGHLKKKIILSTGMANLQEIKTALDVLIGCGTKKENITILHCNTEYPTPYEDVNLKAMDTICEAFRVDVGYSDHTLGIEVPLAAVALGATVIEKHFTLDKNLPGPDHQASLEPHELKNMVQSIRNIEKTFGDGVKKPSSSEFKNIGIARKSIVVSRDVKTGEVLTEENLAVKRPGTGLSPMRWDDVIGTKAKRNFSKDEVLEL